MTAAIISNAGAPSTSTITWAKINWPKVIAEVRQLQMRIAKAFLTDGIEKTGSLNKGLMEA